MTRVVRTALGVVLAVGAAQLLAQVPGVVRPTVIEGVLNFAYGDPAAHLDEPRYAASLRMDDIALPVTLDLDGTDQGLIVRARNLSGRRVRIELRGTWAGLREDGVPRPAGVRSIADISGTSLASASAPMWARRTRPYAVILCKFADVSAEALPVSRYRDRYGAGTGGAESFYQEVSSGRMSIAGTTVFGWYTLPSPRSAYVGSSADLVKLATDCATAADADVDYRKFDGIAFHFNAILDCCAWGGSISLAMDGPARSFPTMWMPPWAGAGVTWHEMGHTFGLPHSGSGDCSSNSWWDVMSFADAGVFVDPDLGSGGAHFIAYHKELLGLIPRDRIAEAGSAGWSGWLAPSEMPSAQLGGYLLLNIPVAEHPGVHYTVEVRQRIGYDARLPGRGVLITKVDPSTYAPSQLADADGDGDANDEGAVWSVGEVFSDPLRGVRIAVDSTAGDRYFVSVTGGSVGPVTLERAGVTLESVQADTTWRRDSLRVLGSARWFARAVLRRPWLRIDRTSGTGGYVTFATRPVGADIGINIDTIRVSADSGIGSVAVVELGVTDSGATPARLSQSVRVLFAAPGVADCGSASVLLSGSATSASWTASVQSGSTLGIGTSGCTASTAPVSGTGPGSVFLNHRAPLLVGQRNVDTVTIRIATAPQTTLYLVSIIEAERAPTVTLSKSGGSRSFFTGELLKGDSVRVAITNGRAPATFSVSHLRWENTLSGYSFFTGAVVHWASPRAGIGTTIDSLFFCPTGFRSTCALFIDTLRVTDEGTRLRVTRLPRHATGATILGEGPVVDSLAIEILGSAGANQRYSVATGRRTFTFWARNFAPGSGYVQLFWNLEGATPGMYIDTITVTAAGVPGSPARLIDTLVVAAAPPMVGDVDAGGSIDANDALLVLRSLVSLPMPAYARIASGDADCDGMVSASDASLILQFNVELPLTSSCLARRSGATSMKGAKAPSP